VTCVKYNDKIPASIFFHRISLEPNGYREILKKIDAGIVIIFIAISTHFHVNFRLFYNVLSLVVFFIRLLCNILT